MGAARLLLGSANDHKHCIYLRYLMAAGPFDGGVRSWLGGHRAQGRDRVRFVYEIEEVPIAAAPDGD